MLRYTVLHTLLSAFTYALAACSSPSEPIVRRDSLPPPNAKGGCFFHGEIYHPQGKTTLGLNTSVPGEQCSNDTTEKVCLSDPTNHTTWNVAGCPAGFIARCPLSESKNWYLYKGPSSELTEGGVKTQKAQFMLSCQHIGKVPEVKWQ